MKEKSMMRKEVLNTILESYMNLNVSYTGKVYYPFINIVLKIWGFEISGFSYSFFDHLAL